MFLKISQITQENTCVGDSFYKVAGQQMCFSVKFAKFLRTSILKNICERLLLNMHKQSLGGYYPKFVVKKSITFSQSTSGGCFACFRRKYLIILRNKELLQYSQTIQICFENSLLRKCYLPKNSLLMRC